MRRERNKNERIASRPQSAPVCARNLANKRAPTLRDKVALGELGARVPVWREEAPSNALKPEECEISWLQEDVEGEPGGEGLVCPTNARSFDNEDSEWNFFSRNGTAVAVVGMPDSLLSKLHSQQWRKSKSSQVARHGHTNKTFAAAKAQDGPRPSSLVLICAIL